MGRSHTAKKKGKGKTKLTSDMIYLIETMGFKWE